MCPISGYPEFLPEEQKEFNKTKDTIRDCFESHGFCQIETPAVELIETLVANGVDHEIYGIHRLADPGTPKKIGLRYDLTTPLKRYVQEHKHKLKFPFKSYQIGPVWRGERPQAGRYRQFYQCDIDKVDILTSEYDIINNTFSVIEVLINTLKKIGLDSKEDFRIEINVVDTDEPTKNQLNFYVYSMLCSNTVNVKINPNLTRGLSYYSGPIFEVFCKHDDYKKSICSGGVYHFGERFTGIGGSIGLSRIWSMRQHSE